MKTVELKVMGNNTMHCSGCENSVKLVLSDLIGVKQVEADHRTQVVRVAFDENKVDLEQVIQELLYLDYQVAPTA